MATTYQGSHQEYDVICQRDVMIPVRDDGASGMLNAESSLNQLSNFAISICSRITGSIADIVAIATGRTADSEGGVLRRVMC